MYRQQGVTPSDRHHAAPTLALVLVAWLIQEGKVPADPNWRQ